MRTRIAIEGIAHGGEGVGRMHGKVVFVPGSLPGEVVEVRIVTDKRRWARAEPTTIVEPAPDRRTPPCGYFGTCGGCDFQHASYRRQLAMKRDIVRGQLEHLGGVDRPDVRPTVASPRPLGYRNRMDFAVLGGRPALHRRRSNDLVAVDPCLLLEDAGARVFERLGDLSGVERLTVRAGTRTGDALVAVVGKVPDHAERWDASVVRILPDGRAQAVIGSPAIDEIVAGERFRISATAFFQVNTAAADLLVDRVRAAADVGPGDVVLDGYAGGGLFTRTVAALGAEAIAVESDPIALGDLRHNVADLASVTVVAGRFEAVTARLARRWDVAVVDPPRKGLGSAGIAAVLSGEPRAIAYVSCDPAALARDVAELATRGFALEWAAPVDLFPQTHHVETVARLVAA